MQQSIDSGVLVDYAAWQNEAVNVLDIWGDKLDEKYPDQDLHDDFPRTLKRKTYEVFEKIKESVANGATIDVNAAEEEINNMVARWWKNFSAAMAGG